MSASAAELWHAGLPGYFWLVRPKCPVTHHGVARRDERGRVEVLELKPSGLRWTDHPGFAQGNPTRVLDWKPLSAGAELRPRMERAFRRRMSWALLSWNCEHLASDVWSGSSRSAQVSRGLAWGVLGLFAAVLGARAVID